MLRRLWTRLQEPEGAATSVGGAAPVSTSAPAAPAAPVSTPSAAPAASGAANTPSGDSSSGGDSPDPFDFAALADYASGKEELVPAPVAEPTPPAVAAPTPPPPVASPPASAQAPVSPPAAPAEPAQPQAPATAQSPASSEQPPQQVNWEDHRKEFLPKLEEMYKLSDQEVQDIQTNPGTAFPQMAAKLHYNVTMALQAAMHQYLPHLIQGQMAQVQARQKDETAFYTRWPALKEAVTKDPKVEATINESFKAFRVANPKATIQDMIEKGGLLAMLTLGLNPVAAAAVASTQAPTMQTPALIPGRPAGTGMQGHVPVRQAGTAPGEQSEADFFAGLAEHHLSGG